MVAVGGICVGNVMGSWQGGSLGLEMVICMEWSGQVWDS